MNRYTNAKIYKLVNNVDNEIYVGSTCMPLNKRMYQHKNRCNDDIYQDRLVYRHLRQVGFQNVSIILLENYPCNNKEELLSREYYWIQAQKSQLNSNMPGRSRQQWVEENRDKSNSYKKAWIEKNVELNRHLKREWYHKNKCNQRETEDENSFDDEIVNNILAYAC